MIFKQTWEGVRISVDGTKETFSANVPGNIQHDYGVAKGFPDVMYGESCRLYENLENDTWEYRTNLQYQRKPTETVWFVSHGIDYRYDIFLNGIKIYEYEGMFRPIEIDITEYLHGEDVLCVLIYPHPKRTGAPVGTRDEADASCKPPVCYGWDWNPRLLISGMWQDAYVETRPQNHITSCEPFYTLDADFASVEVRFEIDCNVPCQIKFYDAAGTLLYSGTEKSFRLKNPQLWWCNGQGVPYLYNWTVENEQDRRTGTLGFRRVRLLRNENAEGPSVFPKTRYEAPFTLELNGQRIFMKGSNWVNPDIFWGTITASRYEELLDLAKDAHMNILRLWGGAGFCKKAFYDFCDQKGILVWQEFMLACNAYPNDERYLKVLESEATAMIHALRPHACLAFWCGGNELFNRWSGMNDQSLPLRLLDKLCYEYDRDHAFLKTSPLTGMGHGGYMFYDNEMGGDVFQCFQHSSCIAYTEFGIPSISAMDTLEKIIPEEERNVIQETPSWILHHAIGAWRPQSHACVPILEHYFGSTNNLSELVERSDILQSEGYKAAFEEMRRQAPRCSAALNWCLNEPWMTAANCSIIRYPAIPKPGYFAVKEALRPVLFSARIPKFDWQSGERFTAEIWLLNDSPLDVSQEVEVLLLIGNQEHRLLYWTAETKARTNQEGAQVCCVLPEEETDHITLVLCSKAGLGSQYRLSYRKQNKKEVRALNL